MNKETINIATKSSSKENEYIYDKKKNKSFYNSNYKAFQYYDKALFIILLIFSLFKENNQSTRNYISFSSYIILKTNATGNIKIFDSKYLSNGNSPDEIRINGNIQGNISNEYYLQGSCSVINLTFYDSPILIDSFFKGCSNLTEIDLSNFNTSQIENMAYMFYGCSSLYSINLSNIDTSNTMSMNFMFYGCISLSSLNLSNFDTSNVISMNCMFYGCASLNSLNLSNFKLANVQNINNLFNDCLKLEFIYLDNSYFNESKAGVIFNSILDNLVICGINIEFENTFSNNILINCAEQIYQNNQIIKCYSNNLSVINKYSCKMCGESFHQLYNDKNNVNSKINCYKSLEDYCDFNYYYNIISDLFFCTEDENCPENYNKLIEDKNQCIDECEKDSIYIYEINNKCYSKPIENINNMNKTKLMNNIIHELLNEFNISDINSGRDKKRVVGNDITVILTSTQNQRNNENISNITMNLGQCENLLKNDYNISQNDSLYILQIVSEEEGMKIPKIEYEIYYPLFNNNNLTKLNLTSCKDTKIEISIAVKINNSLDKYNKSSNYYNDICSKTTSESGTDISLKDRRNEFVNNNMSLCEEKCDLIDYNYNYEKVKCSCDIKLNIPQNYDIKFNKNDYFKSFIDIKNIFNLNIMKCYKIVLKIKYLLKNHGFIIVGFIMVIYFIDLFAFITISYNKLKKEIIHILLALNAINKNINSISVKKTENKLKKNSKKNKNEPNKYNGKLKTTLNKRKINNQLICSTIIDVDISNKKMQMVSFDSNFKINNLMKNILKKTDFELNSVNYKDAIKLDHRSYCAYYFSLLKNDHPILFSFGSYNDYNSKIIKIFLFFFSFCLDFTINALFFTDDTMHKIYQDKGKFNILYQLPQTLYSTIISRFIDAFIRKYALSQETIIELKREKIKNNLDKKYQKIFRTLNIKFILFYIFSFLILIFFWYYITCFCGIYSNTQNHLIKDTFISSITSMIYPFIIDIIPGIFRILALRAGKPSLTCLYKFSQFIS